MKLACYSREGIVSSAAWAHKLDWSAVADDRGFEVYAGSNDNIVADVQWSGCKGCAGNEYFVEFHGKDGGERVITEKEVIPTVQLFLNVAKRRKTLNSGVVMMIYPKF